MSTISNQDRVIDSRDVIERIETLQDEREALQSDIDNCSADDREAFAKLSGALQDWDEANGAELKTLLALQSGAEGSPDWMHGETLIREDYFADYIRELISDCYEMPKELESGEWPWRHVTVDYESAADEARADYIEADFDGVTYLIRA